MQPLFHRQENVEREALRRRIEARGIDLVGFASVTRLESEVAAELRPSTLLSGMASFVVLGKRTLRGVLWSRHLPSKQLAAARTVRYLELAAEETVRELELAGYVSVPVPSAALDFERRGPHDLLPGGQGSTLVRHAAVAAGLGTWGLNRMVLTPDFGPRLYFVGLMTALELEADSPLGEELCPGLEECGRCAAVCPEDAIPRRAPLGAALAECRDLDAAACARSCQPFGYQAFAEHVAGIFEGSDGEAMWKRMRGRKSGEMWTEMAMVKEGATAGCSECLQVCPVGADYERLKSSPHRRHDLPGDVERTVSNGFVEVANVGPQERRRTDWEDRGQKKP